MIQIKSKKEKKLQKNSPGRKWQKKPKKSIKVALVYDRVNKWGGAERVLLALHQIFPDAPLYTSVYHPKKAPWAKVFRIKTSFLQHIVLARSYHQFFAPLMPFAFGSLRFDGYDVVISVTSEAAKGIRVKSGTKHICLCLTPTRYLWSGYEEYFPNIFIRQLTKPLITFFRFVDKKTAQKPHYILAISKEVKRRIKKYYDRESEILYPPLTLHYPKRGEDSYAKNRKKQYPLAKHDKFGHGYFLMVSRLSRFTSYKRVDLAIQAATELGLPLVVIGQGNQQYFKKYAGPTIQFVENVSDKKLQEYYQGAKALIFPAKEDFGLVMVEAQAAGKPVIAYHAGGALEIVQKGVTGEFFYTQSVTALIHVLKSFDESRYNSQSCKENAKRFSFSYFEKSLKEYILKVIESN